MKRKMANIPGSFGQLPGLYGVPSYPITKEGEVYHFSNKTGGPYKYYTGTARESA